MRVLVNGFLALPATEGAGGAGKFFEALLTGLASRVQLRVVASPTNRSGLPDDPDIEYVVVKDEAQELYLPHFAWADIYYDPLNGLGPALIPPRLPVATAIMDLQHNVYPRFFSHAMYEARNRAYGYAVGRADGVITISEYERENIRRVFGTEHVYVVPLSGYTSEPEKGRAPDLLSRARSLSTGDYLIYPAIPWRHKNHFRLLEAAGLLKQTLPEFRLLLTGVERHEVSSTLHSWKLVAEGLEQRVEVRGHLPDAEFAMRMAAARGMVFPSLYEGFGIPVVEAMQMGIPVLTVPETAIPEVAGDAVAYFRDPRNSVRMAEDIRDFWNDEELRTDLARRGREYAARFSRKRFVEDTLAALSDIVLRRRSTGSRVGEWRPPQFEEVQTERPVSAIVVIDQRGEAAAADIANARVALQSALFPDSPVAFIVDRSVPAEILTSALQAGEQYAIASLGDTDEIALAVRFLCESVVGTTYVLYTRSGNLPGFSNAAAAAAMRLMDYRSELGCALLDSRNAAWSVVSPSASEAEAADVVESIRPRRLTFFENLIVRTRLLDTGGPIGSLRLLSTFVRTVSYLSGPAQ
jgi:glycosyltransferase involved in cell wall biosynthesis